MEKHEQITIKLTRRAVTAVVGDTVWSSPAVNQQKVFKSVIRRWFLRDRRPSASRFELQPTFVVM